MTPKEKAQELVNLYLDLMGYAHWNGVPVSVKFNKIMAINCALMAVDEIIKVCHYTSKENLSDYELVGLDDFEFVSYWEEVKQQILKI